MAYVRVRHDNAVVTDGGEPTAASRAATEVSVLKDSALTTYAQLRTLAQGVLSILGGSSHGRMREDGAGFSDGCVPFNHHVGVQPNPIAESDVLADDTEGADFHAPPHPRRRVDDS